MIKCQNTITLRKAHFYIFFSILYHLKIMSSNPFLRRPWMNHLGNAVTADKKILFYIYSTVAGGLTGASEILLTYPTEYVKTQLQLDGKVTNKKYKGVVDCVKKTFHQHGIVEFYRGLTVLLIGSIPKSCIRFGSYTVFKDISTLKDDYGNLTVSGTLLCGMGAGVSEALLIITPMETIKVKLIHDSALDKPRFTGMTNCVKEVFKNEGFFGIYKGVVPTTLKQGSSQAIRWLVVDTFKVFYKGENMEKPIPLYYSCLLGIFAGIASVLGNTPIDVVKTRMQGLESHKYKGTIDCVVKIWRKEGPLAFYKGTLPRIGRVSMNVGLSYAIFDSLMNMFDVLFT